MKYKFLYLLIFCLFPLSFIYSQDYFDRKEYYIGTGYGMGFGQFDKFNSILNKYNEENTQEKEFRELHLPNGFAFVLGANLSIFNIEAGFSQKQQRSKTKFSVNETLMRRDARLRFNTFHIALGAFFPATDRFGFGPNVSVDQNLVAFSTRGGEEGSVGKSSFISPVRDKRYGLTASLRFVFGNMDDHSTKLMLRPYYSYLFKSVDASAFNEVLNGAEVNNLSSNYSHFGLSFIIIYSVVK